MVQNIALLLLVLPSSSLHLYLSVCVCVNVPFTVSFCCLQKLFHFSSLAPVSCDQESIYMLETGAFSTSAVIKHEAVCSWMDATIAGRDHKDAALLIFHSQPVCLRPALENLSYYGDSGSYQRPHSVEPLLHYSQLFTVDTKHT